MICSISRGLTDVWCGRGLWLAHNLSLLGTKNPMSAETTLPELQTLDNPHFVHFGMSTLTISPCCFGRHFYCCEEVEVATPFL